MATEEELAAASDLLVKNLDGRALVAYINRSSNSAAFAAETAKTHALAGVDLPGDAVDAFCAHLFDGGGAFDARLPVNGGLSLAERWMQAVHDRDWASIRHLLPHVVKSWMKREGLVKVLPGGGLQIAGAPSAATVVPAAVEPQKGETK